MKKSKKNILICSIGSLLGITLYILGWSLEKYITLTSKAILFGISASIFFVSFKSLIQYLLANLFGLNTEKIQIEMNDERNIKIKEKTSYICYRIIYYLIITLLLIFYFMKVNEIILYFIIALIIIHSILEAIVSCYYSKRM